MKNEDVPSIDRPRYEEILSRALISRNFDTWNNNRMENYMRHDPISCINIETSHVSTRDRTSLSDKSNNRANICTFLHKSRSHYRNFIINLKHSCENEFICG